MAALITAAEVATECVNDIHFDSSYIKDSYILAAQLEYIKPYLGDDFYDDLVTNPDDYSDLTSYLYPALKWFAYYNALPFIQMRITNQGAVNYNSDNANVIPYKQFADFKQNALDLANSYLKECTRYLDDNSSDYPLWEKQDKVKYNNIIFYESREEKRKKKTSYDYEDE